MLRSLTAALILISVPGPSSWAAVAQILRTPTAAAEGRAVLPAVTAGVGTGFQVQRLPVAMTAPLSARSASSFSAAAATPAARVLPAVTVRAAAVDSAPARGSLPAAPVPVVAGAAPASAGEGAPAASGQEAATANPSAGDAPRPATAEASAESAERMFDGSKVRVTLTRPGEAPLSLSLAQLTDLVAADPSVAAAFRSAKRVRLVVAAEPNPGELNHGDADGVLARLRALGVVAEPGREGRGVARRGLGWVSSRLGLGRVLDVETLTPEVKTKVESVPGGLGWLAWVARQPLFLARQLRDSFTWPTRSEIAGGLLLSSPGLFVSILVYCGLYLNVVPEWATRLLAALGRSTQNVGFHPEAFAMMVALGLALKGFHNIFFVNTWNGFQDRMRRLRGIHYMALFNLMYGTMIAGLYRAIASSVMPNLSGPFSWEFLRDLGIVTIIGTLFGALGGQAPNELRGKGIVTRSGRSLIQQVRSFAQDFESIFFKVGLLGLYWPIFAIKQALDFTFWLLSVSAKDRPMITVASEETASTETYRKLYENATKPSRWERISEAMLDAVPFARLIAEKIAARRAAAGLVALGTILSVQPRSTLAARYEEVLNDDAAFERPGTMERLPLVELIQVQGADGQSRPKRANKIGINVPYITTFPGGGEGVFKALSLPKSDPLYKFDRMKLVYDVVASAVMERMGVPTLRYRLARAVIDGKEVIGALSPFVPELKMVKDDPGLADRIANVDDFVRGSVIDAWQGNIDRITNLGNLWVRRDGGREVVFFGDFDQSFRMRPTIFGVPKVPIPLFTRYVKSEVLGRTIADIAELSDARLREWVDQALAENGDYGGPAMAEYLADVLAFNRDVVIRAGTFDSVLPGHAPRLIFSPGKVAALAEAVLKGRGDAASIPAYVDEALSDLAYVQSYRPELLAPMKALLEELCRRHLNGGDASYEMSSIELLPALMVFVYFKIEPKTAMEQFGYHR